MFFLLSSSGISTTNTPLSSTPSNCVLPRVGMDITPLLWDVQRYYHLGSAESTWKSYSAGVWHYLQFCTLAKKNALPATRSTLLLFVTYLASLNLSYSTIKVYLSRVRSLHTTHGHHIAFSRQLTPRIQVLKDIRKYQAIGASSRICHPITIQIMVGIKSILQKNPHSYHSIMMWAACCLAFFGFLRSSEFIVPSQEAYDKEVHLSLSDLTVDNKPHPRLFRVTIK